jgi:hypothetical protein
MPRTPRLITSAPYWVLLIGSLAATAAGFAMSFPTIDNMSTTLLDGSATTADIYAGQALVTVGGPVLGAGLIGLALTAAIAAAKALVPARPVPAAEALPADEEPEIDDAPAAARLTEEAAPAAGAPVTADEPATARPVPEPEAEQAPTHRA